MDQVFKVYFVVIKASGPKSMNVYVKSR